MGEIVEELIQVSAQLVLFDGLRLGHVFFVRSVERLREPSEYPGYGKATNCEMRRGRNAIIRTLPHCGHSMRKGRR